MHWYLLKYQWGGEMHYGISILKKFFCLCVDHKKKVSKAALQTVIILMSWATFYFEDENNNELEDYDDNPLAEGLWGRDLSEEGEDFGEIGSYGGDKFKCGTKQEWNFVVDNCWKKKGERNENLHSSAASRRDYWQKIGSYIYPKKWTDLRWSGGNYNNHNKLSMKLWSKNVSYAFIQSNLCTNVFIYFNFLLI